MSQIFQSRWQIFCGWCRGRGVAPVNATVPVVVDFLIHLLQDKGLSVSAVKGYSSALNSVLALKGRDLASSREITMLLRSFSRCTLSLTESPPITHPNLPFLFLAAQSEDLPLFRFLVLTFVFLVESKLPVFIYDFLHSLTFYVKLSDEFIALIQRSCPHNAFISD